MKIQIDFPEKYDKLLRLYKENMDLKTKADAIVELAIKGLEPERKTFMKDSDDTKTKIEMLVEGTER